MFVIGLERQVDGIVADGPIETGRSLPAVLRTQGGAGQMPCIHRRYGGGVRDQMDVLPHRVESGLGGQIVPEGILGGSPEFGSPVELGRREGIECRQAHSKVERQFIIRLPVVTGIQGGLDGPVSWQRTEGYQRRIAQRPHLAGIQIIIDGVQAIGESMVIVQDGLETAF